MLRKQQLIILTLAFLILNSCQVFNGIGKKANHAVATDSIQQQKAVNTSIPIEPVSDSIEIALENESLHEISGDSLSIAYQIFDDTSAFAIGFENRFGKNDDIGEDLSMLSGSALVRQLDSLTTVKFFNKYEFVDSLSGFFCLFCEETLVYLTRF